MLLVLVYFIHFIAATDDSATKLATQKYVDKMFAHAQSAKLLSTSDASNVYPKVITDVEVNNKNYIYELPWTLSELDGHMIYMSISFTYEIDATKMKHDDVNIVYFAKSCKDLGLYFKSYQGIRYMIIESASGDYSNVFSRIGGIDIKDKCYIKVQDNSEGALSGRDVGQYTINYIVVV